MVFAGSALLHCVSPALHRKKMRTTTRHTVPGLNSLSGSELELNERTHARTLQGELGLDWRPNDGCFLSARSTYVIIVLTNWAFSLCLTCIYAPYASYRCAGSAVWQQVFREPHKSISVGRNHFGK